jgi:hypothetical protein
MRSILLLLLLVLIVAVIISVSNNEPSTSFAPTSNNDTAPTEPASPQKQATVAHEQPVTASTCSDVAASSGRIYDVASVNTCQAEIPLSSVKLFVQGRIARFGYADMQSRPFAVIEDQQQSSKTLLCGMQPDEGSEVMSLYHIGEVVQVSGDYMGVGPIAGNLSMPLLSDCTVASSTDNVASVTNKEKPEAKKAPDLSSTTSQSSRAFMTVSEFNQRGNFSTYTKVDVQGRIKGGRCGLVDEGRQACWLVLKDDISANSELMMWVQTWDWEDVHSSYKIGDVAQMTCTAFERGLYDCKSASSH